EEIERITRRVFARNLNLSVADLDKAFDEAPSLQDAFDALMDTFATPGFECPDDIPDLLPLPEGVFFDSAMMQQCVAFATEYTERYIAQQAADGDSVDASAYRPIYDRALWIARAAAGDPTAANLYEASRTYQLGHTGRLVAERDRLENVA